MADDDSDEAVGWRVFVLRRTVKPDMTGKQFADFLEVGYNRLNNVENGLPLGKDLMKIIRRKIAGVTSDWLLYGDTIGLHPEFAQSLLETEAKLRSERKSNNFAS